MQDRASLTDRDEFLERNAFFDGSLDRLLKALPHSLGAQFSLGFEFGIERLRRKPPKSIGFPLGRRDLDRGNAFAGLDFRETH